MERIVERIVTTRTDRPSTIRPRVTAPLAAAAAAAVALILTLAGCASPDSPTGAGPGADEGSGSGSGSGADSSEVAEFPTGSWLLASMKDAEGALEDPLPQPTLDIADGRVSGSGGCNSYNAPVADDADGALELGPIVATKRACVEEAANLMETRYLAALEGVTGYAYEGEQLTLVGDGITLSFTADPGGQAGPEDD